MHAAAIEEPQIAESDESWDKDEAYRRFEALLDQHSVTFTAGDKVRGLRPYNTFITWSGRKFMSFYAFKTRILNI